jgi:hypothetical protein
MLVPMTDPRAAPLTTDHDVRDFVAQLVGEAIRPQCWVFLLDGDARPLPVALPIDDLAVVADHREATRLAVALDGIAGGTGASAVLLALERPGPADLTPTEAAWVRNVHRSFDACRADLRALVLVHDRGMRILGAALTGSASARSSRAG